MEPLNAYLTILMLVVVATPRSFVLETTGEACLARGIYLVEL